VAGLPLITNPAGAACVFVPGHIYKPNPLDVTQIGKVAGPGALIDSERKFLASLIRHLGGDSQVLTEQIPAAIKQGQTEYYLLRNIDRSPGATRFRIGEGNWFYPDFIFRIVYYATAPQAQRICYIDPKGLEMGARGGWSNQKLLCFTYKLVEISQTFPQATLEDGTPISLRFKGAFISTSSYSQLKAAMAASPEFQVYGDDGASVFPSVEQFGRCGIFFADRTDYIAKMMAWLSGRESVLEQAMARAASALGLPSDQVPSDEIGAFFLYELRRNAGKIELALAEIVRHSLTASSLPQVEARMQLRARKELLPFLSESRGLKERLVGGIADPALISDPCRVLYRWSLEQGRGESSVR
jgi:hypothetical protein